MRRLIVTIVMLVLGFILGEINIIVTLALGLLGFIFYPHIVSYILAVVFSLVFTTLLVLLEVLAGYYWPFTYSLWNGLVWGFNSSAIISIILHAMKKI